MRTTTTFLFLLLTLVFARGQEIFKPDSVRRTVHAISSSSAIRLDGKLHEPVWRLAGIASSFVQIEPYQGNGARDSTEVKVTYDSKNIYVAAFCRDTLGRKSFKAPDLMRDFNWRAHDTFAITFDGFNDQRNSISFATNPYGAQKDYLSFDDLLFDGDWNGLWQVRTSRADSGWVAEFAIPWKTLRYLKKDSAEWGVNFLRLRRVSNEISVWSKYPRSFGFNRMAYAGVLKGIQPPPPGTNLQVNPYVLLSRQQKEGDNSTEPKIGGEVKWAINSNTVADFTINTDFAQADADLQVNNITRFSVFFPEKRQFFLENASLFGVGTSPNSDFSGGNMRIQPFFSRRIGLDDTGNPIPISAGARMVYRSIKRSAGGLWVRQHEKDTLAAADFIAARFTENIGKQNRLGFLATGKISNSSNNTVSGIDGFFRFGEAHSLSAMALHSSSTGRPDDWAGYAQYFYTTNQFKFWITESVVTKSFNPEVGFVSRNNVVATTPGFYWYYRGSKLPYKKLIRSFEPGVISEFYHSISTGELIERSVSFFPLWLNLQTGGYAGIVITPAFQKIANEFEPLGVSISAGEYSYTRYAIWTGSDLSKKISYLLQYEYGDYFNGKLSATDLQVNFSPLPHIALKLRYNDNYFNQVGESLATRHVRLYSSQLRLAVNPRLQLIGLFQKNTQNNTDSYNVRLAWEYKPLSYVYLVYNNRVNKFDSALSEQNSIVKVSFLKQF